ncbi:hypothetical protein GCM10023165_48700 [Variovorax defluvii]|uniref:HPF/RaiA family ribosome-associated protein n=1 Tax=Variovorax defluvii TaxID=913761 RepID=A0ABP8ICZ6_9BURK
MQVLFNARGAEALAWREVAVMRTRFVMRRLHWMVPRAYVHLDDVNGPRGGPDKRCRIELRAPGADPLVVTSIATDWRRALDTALKRAAHALMRWWRRRRTQPPALRRVPSR